MTKKRARTKQEQHRDRDHAYFDQMNRRSQEKINKYLDPVELRPPHEEQIEQQHEQRIIQKPDS